MDTYRDPNAVSAEVLPAAALTAQVRPRLSKLHLRLSMLVAGAVLPLLILVSAIVLQSYERAREAASERVLQVTRSAMASVDRELQNQIAALEVLALSPALQAGDLEAFRVEAERFLSRFPGGAGLSIADGTGQNLMNTSAAPGTPLQVRSDLAGVLQVFETKKPSVSHIRIGRIIKRPMFTVDVPVMRGDEVIYDLAFAPVLATFYDILNNLNLPEGWVVAIFDSEAHHIARLPMLSQTEITSASPSLAAELAKGDDNRIVETTSLEGSRILTAFTRSPDTGWVVALGMPFDALSSPTRRSLIWALSIGAVLMLVGLMFAGRMANQIVRAEAHRELLVNELNHRVKNTLSSVQAIVHRGLHDSAVTEREKKSIEARLLALSHVHNILSGRNWESADLQDIAVSILGPYSTDRRVITQGTDLWLKPRVAIALAMILNELVTNAVKYGALSGDAGVVHLSWEKTAAGRVLIAWRESGGERMQPPMKMGYGSKFIERAVTGELGGNVETSYLPEGLACVIEISLS